MANIISLSEYKTLKGITSVDATRDAQLNALIPMATSAIEDHCHRKFGGAVYTEKKQGITDHLGRYVFQVDNKPIGAISEITLEFIGCNTPLNVDVSYLNVMSKDGYAYYAYTLQPSISVVREEYRNQFLYNITYSGGENPPSSVKLAASMIVGDTYDYLFFAKDKTTSTGKPSSELSSVSVGDYSESYESGASMYKSMHSENTGIYMTQTVKDLLRPYVRHGQNW